MKLWEKIFMCTLIVFEVFFIPSTMYLINRSFKLNLNSEINSAISEQNRFCNSIKLNITVMNKAENPFTYNDVNYGNLNKNIVSYMKYLSNKKTHFQVFDDSGRKIYDDFKIGAIENKGQWNISKDKVSYEVSEIKEKNYLYVNKRINMYNSYYRVSYIKEISWVYENYRYLCNVLMKLNIFVCITLVIIMIILSKMIISPVNKLIKSTQKISDGNFNERVDINSKDEIGILAKNFNYMTSVIQDNINELKESSEDKQKFIDNLSHEIRSPLTSIIGYTDYLITNKDFDEETFKALNYVYKEGKRLEKMSSKLMDLIVIRKEKPKMKYESIKEILEEIKASMVPRLRDKNIDIVVSSEESSILMDKELIIILIKNFIDNAIKASGEGSKIYVNAYLNIVPIIEIKDRGIGIPRDDIKKIFEPFYMVDKSRDRRNNGVGLGLSICAKIAEIHNAEIKVESEVGIGTTVRIEFNNMEVEE